MDDENGKHLDLLGIFHYVLGGMTALCACFPIIHVVLGVFLLTGELDGPDKPPKLVAWMFIVMGSCFVLAGWALAVAMIVAGRRLRARRSRMFCFVVGCIECLIMPLGTILGVFTLIVLSKEPVKALFPPALTAAGPAARAG